MGFHHSLGCPTPESGVLTGGRGSLRSVFEVQQNRKKETGRPIFDPQGTGEVFLCGGRSTLIQVNSMISPSFISSYMNLNVQIKFPVMFPMYTLYVSRSTPSSSHLEGTRETDTVGVPRKYTSRQDLRETWDRNTKKILPQ